MPERFEDVPVSAPVRILEPHHFVIGQAVGLMVKTGNNVFLWKQDGFDWLCAEIDGLNSGWLSGKYYRTLHLTKLGAEAANPRGPFIYYLSGVYYEKRRKPR
jgi:hypothetical protein